MTSKDDVSTALPPPPSQRPGLVAQMRLDEKSALLTGASGWTTAGVPRLGVEPVFMADGPHGVRRVPEVDSLDMVVALPATCFPTASSLASSWDPDLVRTVAGAIGAEARALGVDVVLGPGVNMKRSPLCGRNFEYFSEDPFLAGELAVAYIEGVQSRGVGACLKHFAVNNQETRRFTVDARLDQRTLREIYLPAFEAAVRRARPWAVMCSYNSVNGRTVSENAYLLTDILRGEWGFDGVVMSDWGAVRDRVAAMAAGLDLEMPGPRAHRAAAVADAVRDGRLPVDAVDAAAARLVRLSELVAGRVASEPVDPAEHHELARRAAADGIVLLKNDGTLPLRDCTRIAVVGRGARVPHYQGTGSSHITPTQVAEPLAELILQAGDAVVEHADGHADGPEERPDLIDEAIGAAARADVAIVFATLPDWKEAEGADRLDIDLPEEQVRLIKAVAAVQPRTVVVLNNGSAVGMGEWVDDAAAVLDAWLMGQAGGGAVADVLFGRVNPSGKLAETFPVRLEDTPSHLNFPGDGDVVRYGEGPFIGYRWYDSRDMAVQFPFGHGLSYTSFEYSGLEVNHDGDVRRGLTLGLRVTNVGAFSGKEVVQVYVRPRGWRVVRPDKALNGFAKVAVDRGETQPVSITLERRAFEHFDPALGWVCDPGQYELLVGSSSRDIRLATTVVVGGERGAAELSRYSTLGDWLEHPVGRAPALRLLEELGAPLAHALGSEPDDPDRLSPLALVFLESMPVPTVAEFAAAPSVFGANGDEVVDTMLDQVIRRSVDVEASYEPKREELGA
jgi:beta-glucosidase